MKHWLRLAKLWVLQLGQYQSPSRKEAWGLRWQEEGRAVTARSEDAGTGAGTSSGCCGMPKPQPPAAGSSYLQPHPAHCSHAPAAGGAAAVAAAAVATATVAAASVAATVAALGVGVLAALGAIALLAVGLLAVLVVPAWWNVG